MVRVLNLSVGVVSSFCVLFARTLSLKITHIYLLIRLFLLNDTSNASLVTSLM